MTTTENHELSADEMIVRLAAMGIDVAPTRSGAPTVAELCAQRLAL